MDTKFNLEAHYHNFMQYLINISKIPISYLCQVCLELPLTRAFHSKMTDKN